ncbi:hypothetical protein [Burkholderia anthina]
MEKRMWGHAPLRWNAGFGLGVDVPRGAFVVACMGMPVEPVDELARSIRRAWPGHGGTRRYRDANRFYAGDARAVASRRFSRTYIDSACILKSRIEKKPGRIVVRPGQKTPSLGTRMVRGKYKTRRAITKYCYSTNGVIL